MRKVRNLPATFVITTLTILLVVAVVSTIVLALFSVSKKATVTLTFAGDVAVEVDGITGPSSSYTWNVATKDNSTTNITSGSAVVSAPVFDDIGVKVTKGATTETPVTVRVFAIVYTTNSSIESLTSSGVSGVTTVTSYTTQEQSLISSVPSGAKYSAICVTKEFSATQSTFTKMLNEFYPLTQTLTDASMGVKTQGIVVVTAKNRSVATGQTITTDDWNGIINFSEKGIKWS